MRDKAFSENLTRIDEEFLAPESVISALKPILQPDPFSKTEEIEKLKRELGERTFNMVLVGGKYLTFFANPDIDTYIILFTSTLLNEGRIVVENGRSQRYFSINLEEFPDQRLLWNYRFQTSMGIAIRDPSPETLERLKRNWFSIVIAFKVETAAAQTRFSRLTTPVELTTIPIVVSAVSLVDQTVVLARWERDTGLSSRTENTARPEH